MTDHLENLRARISDLHSRIDEKFGDVALAPDDPVSAKALELRRDAERVSAAAGKLHPAVGEAVVSELNHDIDLLARSIDEWEPQAEADK